MAPTAPLAREPNDPAPSAPAPAPLVSARVQVFAITWLAYATYYFARKNVSVTKTALEDQLGLTGHELGLIDTSYLAAYAVGQLTLGVVGDRIGARRLVGFGMLASALLVILAGAYASAVTLLVLFGLNGLAQATGWPGTVKAMTPWFPAVSRGRVMGIWSTCYQVGGLAAGAATTWLNATHGWKAAFFVPAAWVACVGGLVLLALPEQEQGGKAGRLAVQLGILRDPSVWSLGATYFCLKMIRYSLLFWLPYYLERVLRYERAASGYRSLAFELGGIVGAVAVGAVSDRLFGGRRALAGLLGCLGLAAALGIYAGVAHLGPAWNFAGLALVGFLLFGPDALISGATAQDLGGKDASGTAAGFINGLGSVGAVLQGWVTATVSARYGWDALFIGFLCLALVAAVGLVPRVLVERRAAVPPVV